MAGAITALVAEKRAVGYKYDAEERVLARFAAFCASQFPGLEAPDRASVEAWITSARQRGVKPATLQGLAAPVRELARWLGRRGVPRLRPARRGAAQARPLRPAHLHRPGAGGPVRPDRPLSLRLAGPVPAPGHAGAVPHDLRLRPACLRSPAAALRRRRRRCRGPDHPRRQGRQRPAGAGQRAAARTARRLSRPESPGAPAGTGSSPARQGSR